MSEDAIVRIEADTSQFEGALRNLAGLADRFGGQLTNALKSAVLGGRTLEQVLSRIGLNLAGMALEQGLSPLRNLAGGLIRGLIGRILPFASGGVVPFANGGVVSAPTYFPMRGGTGLMGEAGAEAIMPLRRGADGRLGVAGGAASSVHVTFNVSTPDVQSFRKSEAQVTAMLARAVARGSRTF